MRSERVHWAAGLGQGGLPSCPGRSLVGGEADPVRGKGEEEAEWQERDIWSEGEGCRERIGNESRKWGGV